MLPRVVPAIRGLSATGQLSPLLPPPRPASSRSKAKNKPTVENEMAEARKWLENITPETIPERISKGSIVGEGGVSKKSVKFQQHTPSSELLPLTPKPMHEAIRQHRYCSPSSGHMVITSGDAGKKMNNKVSAEKRECSRKLYSMPREVGEEAIPAKRVQLDGSEKNHVSVPYALCRTMKPSEFTRAKSTMRAAQRGEKERTRKTKLEQQAEDRKQSSNRGQ